MGNIKISLVLSTSKSYRRAAQKSRPYKSYSPGTLLRLASLVPRELDADVRLIDLTVKKLPNEIFNSDLVGISTITCGAPYAYELAGLLREKGITVILGGSHPTAMPEEALLHADSVVVGYGEKTWPQLLLDWSHGQLKKKYTDFSNPFDTPSPIIDYSLSWDKPYFYKRVVEFSRGCPNSCAFCTVATLNNKKCYKKNINEIMEEVRRLGKIVLFLDSNFTANLDVVRPLWKAFKNEGITWYGAGTLGFAENRSAVKLAAESGCKGLLIGFESINTGSMVSSSKFFNRPQFYKDAVVSLHDHGIQILGCFVFGLDDDGPDVFERTVEFGQKAKIDMLRYAIATPLPGTVFYHRLSREKRIFEHDWEYYDTEHVVFFPAKMSIMELYEGHAFAYRESYRVKNIFGRIFDCFSLVSLFGNIAFRRLAYTFNSGHMEHAGGTDLIHEGDN